MMAIMDAFSHPSLFSSANLFTGQDPRLCYQRAILMAHHALDLHKVRPSTHFKA
jgi:hypothetical protein